MLSWSPTSLDLLDSVQYAVVMACGISEDETEVAYVGMITGTNYQFAMTDQAPTLWTYSPSRGAAATVTVTRPRGGRSHEGEISVRTFPFAAFSVC